MYQHHRDKIELRSYKAPTGAELRGIKDPKN